MVAMRGSTWSIERRAAHAIGVGASLAMVAGRFGWRNRLGVLWWRKGYGEVASAEWGVRSGEWTPRRSDAIPPPPVFCKKSLQTAENKGRRLGKEDKERQRVRKLLRIRDM
jgi:hypothetical protein